MYNLLISEQTADLLIQYLFYGGILIVGLIVLGIIKRNEKKPVSALIVSSSEKIIKQIDKLLTKEKKSKNDYTMPAKIIKINSEVGDLVVIAEGEYTQNKNITYEGILACYKRAYNALTALELPYEEEKVMQVLNQTKDELNGALDVLKRV